MEPNVTLRSNVYLNKTARKNDADFVRQLRDYNTLLKYYDPIYRTSEVSLTDVQRAILKNGPPKCSLEKGTQSWGVPTDSERFVCRCEELQCPQYPICSKLENFERITRETDGNVSPTLPIPSDASDSCLGGAETAEIRAKQDEEFLVVLSESSDINTGVTNPSPNIQTDDQTPPQLGQSFLLPDRWQEKTFSNISRAATPKSSDILLSSQETIIDADIRSRICVNAGPGTGKTYVVIKRLQKLLTNPDSTKAILVLCFSKNAVYVVKDRLRKEIGNRIDALIAEERLIIRTFDSFATYVLADELPKGLDYDQRIELFVQKVGQTDLLNSVEYLIVDEMQDTVGVRARMLKSIVEQSNFGVLLLGDRCQAIYDWTARSGNDWTSTELFTWISSQEFQIIELGNNHRQELGIGELGSIMRQSLLNGNEDEQERTLLLCKEKMEKLWPGYTMSKLPQNLLQKDELILCKTNGEAAAISDLLWSKLIEHTVRQSASHKTLAPWIGMILGGYTEPVISKDDFLTRAETYGIDDAEAKWEALLSLDSHVRSEVLHRLEVLTRLAAMDDLPDICLNRLGDGVIVSTVHRAKGSEADHAYWMDSPLVFDKQADEDRVRADALNAAYVAMTRARKDIRLITPEKLYIRSLGNGRWIKTGMGKNRRAYCAGITLQSDDVDLVSCVSGPEAEQIQDVIRSLTSGLDVKLYPIPNSLCFDIFFDGIPIGKTSAKFTDALFEGFWTTNKNRNMPISIDSAYISDIVTVIQLSGTNVENEYQASGCWLGYELGGFALIHYT